MALTQFVRTLQTLSPFILILGVFILCLWLMRLIWMLTQAIRLWVSRRKILAFLSSVQVASGEERTDGLRLERIEAMRLWSLSNQSLLGSRTRHCYAIKSSPRTPHLR